jgi:two-component system LytT family sensor kinase
LKRLSLHIAFWAAYLAQDITLIYLWDKSSLSRISPDQQIIHALINSSISLIPKVLFAYCLLYYHLPRLLNSRSSAESRKNIIYLLCTLAASILLYRALATFIIFPVFYKGLVTHYPFFRALGFLDMLMDIGFAAGAATVIKQVRVQLAAKEKEKNLLREKLETELKFLRNQTNPHFLFNTLNNIYALARKKSDDTADAVMKLAKLLRFMLYESKKDLIPVSDEIRMLEDYIELQKMRYNGRLSIRFLREIDNESEQIAPLLLIPFVENAFMQEPAESGFAAMISLDLKLHKGILTLSIENTREPGGREPSEEYAGLSNVQRQLELMYKKYEVTQEDEASFFKVTLTINLRTYENISLADH